MTEEKIDAPAWTPPPGVHPAVIHGAADGPLLIAMVTLDPLAEVPTEIHEDQEETIVWLGGPRVRVDAGHGVPYSIGCGGLDRVLVGAGVPHVVRNEHPTKASTYLAILRRV
jgi:uncharacterized RmlC-like cupin family protein